MGTNELRVRLGAIRVSLASIKGTPRHKAVSRVQGVAVAEVLKRCVSVLTAEERADVAMLVNEID